MHIRFLLGPAGSGKTHRCLAEIRAELAASPEGGPLIFLAPKQATFQLERQLLADPALAGYTRLQIVSFERLAEYVFEALQLASPELLNDEGRLMVLRALLARKAPQMKLFRRMLTRVVHGPRPSPLRSSLRNGGRRQGSAVRAARDFAPTGPAPSEAMPPERPNRGVIA